MEGDSLPGARLVGLGFLGILTMTPSGWSLRLVVSTATSSERLNAPHQPTNSNARSLRPLRSSPSGSPARRSARKRGVRPGEVPPLVRPCHTDSHMESTKRRRGDEIEIEGSYQYQALTAGHPIQRFWHQTKLNLLDWAFEVGVGDSVIDVGCGSGVFAAEMAARGAAVLGVDANSEAVDFANGRYKQPNLSFSVGYLDKLDLEPESFNKAVCLEVIEHVFPDQVRHLLQNLSRVLQPEGELLVTTPNYRGVWPAVEWSLDRFASSADMDHAQHVTRFNRHLLKSMLKESGFRVTRIQTFSTLAPFLAAFSRSLAAKTERLERKVDLPFGNLLMATAVRSGVDLE